DGLAHKHGLNAKYLTTLWQSLTSREPSLLLDTLRTRWRQSGPSDVAAISANVSAWQKGLWKFNTVGHIGKVGGPKAWLEPVTPLVNKQEIRYKIPASTDGKRVTLSLITSDAGDGNEHDYVVWQRPRLVAPGRPDLLLRDVRKIMHNLSRQRHEMFVLTVKYLGAAAEAALAGGKMDIPALAQKHDIDTEGLRAWADYLGISSVGRSTPTGHFTKKLERVSGYDFIKGWGYTETPFLLANSSDQHVRIPGNMKPHTIAVHPSPTKRAVIGWCSPITSLFRIDATVTHAHPECGNGVTWSIELKRGTTRQSLATGIAHGSQEVKINPIQRLPLP